jgi:hypothetical protein
MKSLAAVPLASAFQAAAPLGKVKAVKYTLPQVATELERIDQDVAELAAIRKVFGSQVTSPS